MTRSDLKDTAGVEPDNSHHSEVDEKLIVGHGPLADFLTENVAPVSKSSIAKYCSPAINTGPPVEAYWGRLPAFKPSRALAWAKARMRPVDEARSHPATATGPAFVPQKPRAQAPASKAAAGPPPQRKRGHPPKVRPAGNAASNSAATGARETAIVSQGQPRRRKVHQVEETAG